MSKTGSHVRSKRVGQVTRPSGVVGIVVSSFPAIQAKITGGRCTQGHGEVRGGRHGLSGP